MKQLYAFILVVSLVGMTPVQSQLLPNLGGQRAGVSALPFLKIDVSPRAAGMGGAQIAVLGDAYAAQWNPAALTDVEHISFSGANTFWFAGINHAFFTGVLPNPKIGTLALQATALTAGAMERRTEFQPGGTGEYFYASNAAIGLSYAKQLTPMFSYGLTLKYVNETLDNFVAHTVLADMGFLYRTDFKKLNFAVTLHNFGANSRMSGTAPESPTTVQPRALGSYPPPTTFSIGASLTPIETEKHRLLTVLQLNHPNDNSANVRLGIEYAFHNLLFLRAGYKIGIADQYLPSLGAGVRTKVGKHPLLVDYAVDPHPYLGWQQRIGLTFALNRSTRNTNENPTPPAE